VNAFGETALAGFENYVGMLEIQWSARLGQVRSVWSLWFIWLVWFNQIIKTDRTDETDQTDKITVFFSILLERLGGIIEMGQRVTKGMTH
jgi:hypothetical protein